MLIALFADIHANRQAFEACLGAARERGAERVVLLGDYVGYGADPEWTVTTCMWRLPRLTTICISCIRIVWETRH